ncbi:MAG: hypothetical protein COB20_14380 [SAR86 cluster bacterium]|uniref:DUF4156 domain-containing protein n=1 Tax=SAR86 cluster bacterium TaxID=2030880 RepID=A0A2A4WWX5_9GAMM|nr:MAG: hypothetical protein COB20_14380 [SAR86 cluster bacterium]
MRGNDWTAKYLIITASAFMLQACAVTGISPEGANVRVISETQASDCVFVDNVATSNSNTLIEDPQQDARNKAFNRVAVLGGNSLRIVSTNSQIAPSGLGSIFTLSGEVYRCN